VLLYSDLLKIIGRWLFQTVGCRSLTWGTEQTDVPDCCTDVTIEPGRKSQPNGTAAQEHGVSQTVVQNSKVMTFTIFRLSSLHR
jgi:hypothetical protein